MKKNLIFLLLISLLCVGCVFSLDNPADPAVATTESDVADVMEPTATAGPTATKTNEPTLEPTVVPTETAEPILEDGAIEERFAIEGLITIYGDSAAVSNDSIGPAGVQFTDPGAVVFHDGQYHMFHNAFTGWPAPVDVMYSVSDDGLTWELVQDEPVFEGEDLPFVGVAALASSVIVTADGTWMMYFYTWDEPRWPVSESEIGLATAPSPLGPWTALDEPVLTFGDRGEWDDLAVRTPSVQIVDGSYVMFYSGHTRQTAAIGQAFSEDGIEWTKFDDPETVDAPYQQSDPVFMASEDGWDAGFVYQPRVRKTADGWVMLYTRAERVNGPTLSQDHGLAFSADGLNWSRSDTPMFEPSDVHSGGRNIWFTELAYGQDRYSIFFELGVGGQTEIYVATFDSRMLPK